MKKNSADTVIVVLESKDAAAYIERQLATHAKNNSKKSKS